MAGNVIAGIGIAFGIVCFIFVVAVVVISIIRNEDTEEEDV